MLFRLVKCYIYAKLQIIINKWKQIRKLIEQYFQLPENSL